MGANPALEVPESRPRNVLGRESETPQYRGMSPGRCPASTLVGHLDIEHGQPAELVEVAAEWPEPVAAGRRHLLADIGSISNRALLARRDRPVQRGEAVAVLYDERVGGEAGRGSQR